MTAEGDNRVLFTKVTKESLAALAKGKHVFPKAVRSRGENAPIDIATATLQDLLWLFVERERLQLTSLAHTMQTKLAAGEKLFEIWMLESSDEIQAAAMSIGLRIALQQAIAVLASMKTKYTNGAQDQRTQAVLDDLIHLYALRRIEMDLPWFLTNRVLSIEQGAQVPQRVRALCKAIAPFALKLVQGFGQLH